MSESGATARNVNRLHSIRRRFNPAESAEKLQLMRLLINAEVSSCRGLQRLHDALCFIRAFPDSRSHYSEARSLLLEFEARVLKLPAKARAGLADTGISGTVINYAFSWELANWMARRFPGAISIHWEDVEETSRLEELLELTLLPSEVDYFDSGFISSEEWIDLASGNAAGTYFDWLITQLAHARKGSGLADKYNAAELALAWDLQGSKACKSLNTLSGAAPVGRRIGLRRQPAGVKAVIRRPVDSLRRLSPRLGRRLIDVAMTSMAVRHRETYHFNFANPHEVYVADIGEGVSIAVLGLQKEHRFVFECTMGYLILSNGVPVGYGGASAIFSQLNTGINIFDEYRGSEAAFLWVQVMRVFHHLVACERFIANPYQLGSDNVEALQSGAFWFYYRLGYRPALAEIRRLARSEYRQITRENGYRSSLGTLRRLSSTDMHLVLPGARSSALFEEHWIETSSMLAARQLAAAGGRTRAISAKRVAAQVARDLGLQSLNKWSQAEKLAFTGLAPVVAAAEPSSWPSEAKQTMRILLRAKGGAAEVKYARLLAEHRHFLSALRAKCLLAERL